MTSMTIPGLLAVSLLGFAATTTMAAGDCKGNDSRCSGSSQAECIQLQNQGSDCKWVSSATSIETTLALEPEPAPGPSYTTSFEPEPAPDLTMEPEPATDPTTSAPVTPRIEPDSSGQGECEGNDSRCAGSSQARCNELKNQGSDCRWSESSTNSQGLGGDCLGNDSRCANSHHAKCIRLSQRGADCRWESSASASSSGMCAGNDSRCNGKSEQSCDFLSQEGADCKWRADFTLAGALTMRMTNASSFAENPNSTVAMKDSIANLTRVPSEHIDVDLHVVAEHSRRLEGRALAQTETLVVTYVIVVGPRVPASVAVTGNEIGEVMKASNIDQISATISSKVAESFGSDGFNIVVAEVAPPLLTFSSSSTNTTTSVSAISSSIPSPTSTTTDSGSFADDNGALLSGCAHPLLVLLGITIYLR